MKIYLVVEDTDLHGYTVRHAFLNKEKAEKVVAIRHVKIELANELHSQFLKLPKMPDEETFKWYVDRGISKDEWYLSEFYVEEIEVEDA